MLLLPLAAAGHADQRVILVMGDSLSAAYNMEHKDGWVHRLDQRLQEQMPGWTVVNTSISGDTTRGGLSRLPRALERHQPDLVIIALGGNDGLRGVNPAEIGQNLTRMVELAQDADATVLLAGVRIPPNYGSAYTERFEQAFTQTAEATGARLLPRILDGVDERPELFMDDRIHPTEDAQPIILDNVWSKLGPLLGE